MRKIVSLLSMLMLFSALAIGQTRTVSGQVNDERGDPVPFASVTETGTQNATTADAGGLFSITINQGSRLTITAVGYDASTITPGAGAQSITLTAQAGELAEVVVTALGIRREKKALGYAVATVNKEALELRSDGDVVRLLSGKAPGVDIFNVSGMSGSGTNIIIRGVNTISGSSTPLFVVDGVPFDASTNAQASFIYGNTTSSRFLDLDPNNIESISVLKGLNATILYGELGRNGVVLITTKSGAARTMKKKTEITVSQSYFQNKVANLPEYQNNWGGGFDQSVGLVFFSNWGARLTNPPLQVRHPYDRPALHAAFPEFIGAMYDFKPYNSVARFFRTGNIFSNSINIASSGVNSSFNASYSYMDDEGFTIGNRLTKNMFGMGGTAKLNNNVTLSGTFNYTNTDFKSPPTSPSFGSNPQVSSVFGNLIYTPRTVDLIGLPYENPLDKSSVWFRAGNDQQHPLWTVNNSFTGQKINRVFGSMQLKYEILKDLNINYRVGFDNYSDFNFLSQNKGGVAGGSQYVLGIHRTVNGINTIWDHTLLTNYRKDLTADWKLDVDAGINSQERKYSQNGQKSTQQLVYGLFDHDNFIVHENVDEGMGGIDFKSATQSIGVFAQGVFAYREFLYLTAGGRNSWTSNLEKANRSLFYPGGSVSFIPTSAIDALRGNKMINYLKVRAGYATSANFGEPFTTRPVLNISTNVFVDRVGTVLNANSIGNRLANPDLKAELLGEAEVGIEGRFINHRVNLDLTFYRRVSSDQILDRDLDPATGFTVTSINAGSVSNKGIELGLGYTAIRTKDWRWQVDGNFTLNRSRVFDLPADIKQIIIGGFTSMGLFAINDQPLGIIQGHFTVKYLKKDPAGNVVPDPSNGKRIVTASGMYLRSTEIGIIGDPTPDFRLTGISTLNYKGFSFRMQWDYTHGGNILAQTPGTLVARGVTKDTDFDRHLPWILPGVQADGSPNTVQISTSEAYFSNISGFGFDGLHELTVYDATVIRLREASLSYNLPESVLRKTPFGSASLTVSGQNLWYNAPNFPKYTNFDPETSSLGVSNVRGLEYLSGPTSRRLGMSLKVTF